MLCVDFFILRLVVMLIFFFFLGLFCIIEYKIFNVVCLNRDVLWIVLVSLYDCESVGFFDWEYVFNR